MYVNSNPQGISWFSSASVAAPQMMGNSNGDMLRVLDACLINGFGNQTVTAVSKVDNLITFTTAPNHGYLERQYILISGATSSGLNGKHRVVSVTSDTVTVNVPAITDTSGTILLKVAPLNWESVFGATEPLKRAYRSKSDNSLKRIIYLDMSLLTNHKYHTTSPAKRAMVSVCNNMATIGDLSQSITTDTDTTSVAPNGSLHWYQKRGIANTTAVTSTKSAWRLIGNGDFFYLLVGWSSAAGFDSQPFTEQYGFGQYQELMTSGADTTFLMADRIVNDIDTAKYIGATGGSQMSSLASYGYSQVCLFKDGLRKIYCISPLSLKSATFTSGLNGSSFPNSFGNSVVTLPCKIMEDTTYSTQTVMVTGVMPCMMYVDSDIALGHDGLVLDDMVLLQVQTYPAGAPQAGVIGYYLGD